MNLSTDIEDSNRSIHSNWMLSFGDLLTLILCFFLSILSFGPLNPTNDSGNKDDGNQEVKGESAPNISALADVEKDGTAIANSKVGDENLTVPINPNAVEGLRLWFVEGDYDAGSWELTTQAAERLKSQVVRTAYVPKRVTIESCLESGLPQDETAWAGAISRVLGLRSQLIDAGFKSGLFQFRILGPHCSAVRLSGADEAVEAKFAVSRITVEFETKNG